MNLKQLTTCFVLLFLTACIHVDDKLRGYPYFDVQVQRGDSLTSLGNLFEVPWRFIAYINELAPNAILMPGQILKIPQTDIAWQSPIVRQRLANQVLPETEKQATSPSSTSKKSRVKTTQYKDASLYWPVDGNIISHFGPRSGRMHHGVDIKAAAGTPIHAAEAGKVIFSGWQRGYGRTVIIEHDSFRTLYAHCSKLKVKKGDWIEKASLIGRVGASGRATGPHLHFEIRTLDGRPIDPGRQEIAGLFRR
ncbi:MAG: peptidoglycan DD-metalloendopeptidase family protein [Oligoflexus sp.]